MAARRLVLLCGCIALLGCTLALLLGCGSGPPEAPKGASRKTKLLEPTPRAKVQAPSGPLRVLHAAPKGEVGEHQQISIVFDRALRKLSTELPPVPRVDTEPLLRGRWEWVGTHAVVFLPENLRFPSATTVRVTVPTTLRALDGTALTAPYRFEFSTPRPSVECLGGSWYQIGSKARLWIETEGEMAFDELDRALTLTSEPEGKLEWEVRSDHERSSRFYTIVPKPAWPLGATLRVKVDPSFANVVVDQGSEPAGACSYRIHRPPEIRASCWGPVEGGLCRGRSFTFRSENPVNARELKAALRIEPPAPLYLRSSQMLSVGPLAPNREYVVSVARGVRGEHGGTTREQTLTLRTGPRAQELGLGASDGQLEPSLLRPIPLFVTNVREVSTAVVSLSLSQWLELGAATDDERNGLASALLEAHWRHEKPVLDQNGSGKQLVDVRRALGDRGRGAVLIGARAPALRQDLTLIQVSDLALTTKRWRTGGRVWVTRLSSPEPVAAARVTLFSDGKRVWGGVADGLGGLDLPAEAAVVERADEGSTLALVVERDGDGSAQMLNWRGSLLENDHSKPDPERVVALFTDRGEYKPGETVYVKGIVHQQGRGFGRPAANAKTTLKVLRSYQNQLDRTLHLVTNDHGAFSASLELRPGAYGEYVLEAESGDATGRAKLNVSYYRPAEFEVKLRAPAAAVLGETIHLGVTGRYFSGEPMPGALLSWRVTATPSFFRPKGIEAATTDAWILGGRYDPRSFPSVPLTDVPLAVNGDLELEWKPAGPLRGPVDLLVGTAVTDASRQLNGAESRTLLHPAQHYVGLTSLPWATKGKRLEFGVLAAMPSGDKLDSVGIDVALLRKEERRTDADNEEGFELVTESTCRVVSNIARRSCELVPKRSGSYVLHATSLDAKGQLAQAAREVLVSDDIEAPSDLVADYRPDTPEVSLALDRAQYGSKDTARLRFRSPFSSARALVTLEREGVFWERRFVCGKTGSVEIPVTEAIGRGAKVRVLLHRSPGRRSAERKQNVPLEPIVAHGSIWLDVDPNVRRLHVAIAPDRSSAAPGEEVELDVSVRGPDGQPREAELAVWAADEGVLALSAFQTPDLLPSFTKPQSDATETYDTRVALATYWLEPLEGRVYHGGGRSGPDNRLRNPSLLTRTAREAGPTTPLFVPHLRTDRAGRARTTLRLPGQLTRFRLMAVAHTADGLIGSGESSVTARLPLRARAALPRFLRVLDRASAGVVVSTDSAEPEKVVIRASAQGLLLENSGVAEVMLDASRPREVTFPWRATTEGEARVRFEIDAPNHRDTLEAKLPIQAVSHVETVALYGDTSGTATEEVGELTGIDRARSKLAITLSGSALSGLGPELDGLVQYPHDCTEQLSDKLLALGPLRSFWLATGHHLPENAEEVFEQTLKTVRERQRADGGFSFWDYGESAPFLTAYVVWVLEQVAAAQHPVAQHPVSKASLERAQSYLAKALAAGPASRPEPAVQALILDVLAAAVDRREVSQTWHRLLLNWQRLPLFAQAWLLHAAPPLRERYGDPGGRAEALRESVVSSLRLSGADAYAEAAGSTRGDLLDSPDRTTALVLRALLANEPKHPLVPAVVRGLLAMRRGAGWSSTHATAYALVALDEYRRAHELTSSDVVGRVWVGDAELLQATFSGAFAKPASAELSAAALAPGLPLVFQAQGRGTLHYSARLSFAYSSLPTEAAGLGFTLEHVVTPLRSAGALPRAEDLGATLELLAGEAVLGHALVVTPTLRHHVVVDVPLPAGLEAIERYSTVTPRWLRGDYNAPYWWEVREYGFGGSARTEQRDDRVQFFVEQMKPGLHSFTYIARATTVGRFVRPPATVEEMYAPEHFARTAGGMVDVVRR